MSVIKVDLKDFPFKVEGVPDDPTSAPHDKTLYNGYDFDNAFISGLKSDLKMNSVVVFENSFNVNGLPGIPKNFTPTGDRFCSDIVNRAIELLLKTGQIPVSYQSENSGSLYVNLVPMEGESQQAIKSTKDMRGHTDAIDHALVEEEIAKGISPSPNTVILICLSNPGETATKICCLDDVLQLLKPETIDQLKLPQFIVEPQGTFKDLEPQINAPILRDNPQGLRFSHGKISVDKMSPNAESADAALEELRSIVSKCYEYVVLKPGDIAFINNHNAIHGRAEVGDHKRWLLRMYAINHDTVCYPANGMPSYVLHP